MLQPYEIGILPILQMGKLWLREMKGLAQVNEEIGIRTLFFCVSFTRISSRTNCSDNTFLWQVV